MNTHGSSRYRGTIQYFFDTCLRAQLPFNNACHTPQTTLPGVHVGMSSRGLEVTRDPTSHVKKTLPPMLTGFPGEAQISYFVKTTVARQGLLKENPRAYSPFKFIPIEPPRPPLTGSQVFARQKHAFESTYEGGGKRDKMKSFFSKADDGLSSSMSPSASVDIRLPDPAILTCNQHIPLSIVFKKLNSSKHVIFLQSLQISLLGDTNIRAHELYRVEQISWVLLSKSNMNIKIGNESDAEGTETVLDDQLWRSIPLPSSVAPSFDSCNISRSYKIDVRVGLSYSSSTFNISKVRHHAVVVCFLACLIAPETDV